MLRSLLKSLVAANAGRRGAQARVASLVEQGLAEQAAGRLSAAEQRYREALELAPADTGCLQLLGAVLNQAGRPGEAIAWLERCLQHDASDSAARYQLGVALRMEERFEEAIECYRTIGAGDPLYAPAQLNLGNLQRERGCTNEAREAYRAAARTGARSSEIWHNLGSVEFDLAEYRAAIASFDRALAIAPQAEETRFSRALALLACGDLRAGWEAYEARLRIERFANNRRLFTQPLWNGESLKSDERLLVWGEQGIAEEILFAATYRDLFERVPNVVLECAPKLVPLFRRSFPAARVAARTDPPTAECIENVALQCPAGSLGRWLRPSLDRFAHQRAYLVPDPVRVARWRQRLAALGDGIKVGFSWRSISTRTGSEGLSFTRLEAWDELLRVPGIDWICLQYNECEAELQAARARTGIALHRFPDVNYLDDLDEVAALMAALDLVVTVRTAVCYEAAALGVETWQLMHGGDWQTHGTERNAWLPAIVRFPRASGAAWEDVLHGLAGRLRAKVEGAGPEAPGSRDTLATEGADDPAAQPNAAGRYHSEPLMSPAASPHADSMAAGKDCAVAPAHSIDLDRSVTDGPQAWEERGTAAAQRGDHASALSAFQRATASQPDSVAAWIGVAKAARALGDNRAAARAFRRATELCEGVAELHFNLGLVLDELAERQEAEACYRRAVAIRPGLFPAHLRLGLLLLRADTPDQAEPVLRRALEMDPASTEARFHLGLALQSLGRLAEARQAYRNVLHFDPRHFEACFNLGGSLLESGALDEALAMFQSALESSGKDASANEQRRQCFQALAETERRRGRHDEAMIHYERALALAPADADLHYRAGVACFLCEDLERALAHHRKAVAIAPGHHEARIALNRTLHEMGRVDEAIRGYRRMIAERADDAQAHWNLAHALLASGELAAGYEEYEWRFHPDVGVARKRELPWPEWRGEPLRDKRIVLCREQGIGDQLLWASLFPELIAQGARSVIECTPKLVALFARSFPDAHVVAKSDPPHPLVREPSDYACAAGSLARHLRPTPESIVPVGTLLRADSARVAYWRKRLQALGPEPKIGFSWRSHDRSGERILACIPVEAWRTVLAVPGVRFICLQYDDCEAELARVDRKVERFAELDMFDDLDETAAMVSALDLVISAPTSVSVLAAALGVPTWQLSHGADWQMLGRDRHLWFQALERFTRAWAQPWDAVLDTIAGRLQQWLAQRDAS